MPHIALPQQTGNDSSGCIPARCIFLARIPCRPSSAPRAPREYALSWLAGRTLAVRQWVRKGRELVIWICMIPCWLQQCSACSICMWIGWVRRWLKTWEAFARKGALIAEKGYVSMPMTSKTAGHGKWRVGCSDVSTENHYLWVWLTIGKAHDFRYLMFLYRWMSSLTASEMVTAEQLCGNPRPIINKLRRRAALKTVQLPKR